MRGDRGAGRREKGAVRIATREERGVYTCTHADVDAQVDTDVDAEVDSDADADRPVLTNADT